MVIEDISCRPTDHVPVARDGPLGASAIPPRTPGDVLLFHSLFEFFPVGITIDAKDGERLAFETLNERPLVRVHGPARASPVTPKIEDHHLAAIVAQLKLL